MSHEFEDVYDLSDDVVLCFLCVLPSQGLVIFIYPYDVYCVVVIRNADQYGTRDEKGYEEHYL